MDPDLLVTGAILHDIGKVRELSWRSNFEYTLEGQLIGHISIAQGMLQEKIAELDRAAAAALSRAVYGQQGARPQDGADQRGDSQPEPFPQPLRMLVEHMLLSHHGKLEFGSPKLPMTPEAMLLSALDDLEAKFQTLRTEFASAASAGRSATELTEWVRSMDRALFNSRAYLAQESGLQPKPAAEPPPGAGEES